MNSKCIYSGISLEYQIGMLKPDTEYKFEVIYYLQIKIFKASISQTMLLNLYNNQILR